MTISTIVPSIFDIAGYPSNHNIQPSFGVSHSHPTFMAHFRYSIFDIRYRQLTKMVLESGKGVFPTPVSRDVALPTPPNHEDDNDDPTSDDANSSPPFHRPLICDIILQISPKIGRSRHPRLRRPRVPLLSKKSTGSTTTTTALSYIASQSMHDQNNMILENVFPETIYHVMEAERQ